jgi:hypothetical protein
MTRYKSTYWKNRKFLFPFALKTKLDFTNEDIEICISVLHPDEKKILNKRIKEMSNISQEEKNNRIYKILCVIIDMSA